MQKTDKASDKDVFLSIFLGIFAVALMWYGGAIVVRMFSLL